jgi:hypothetical protein
MSLTGSPFTTAVKRVLDPVMVERGFLPGQGGDVPAPGRTDIIYCAALDDFERRWPLVFERVNALHGSQLREALTLGRCIDLTIRGSHVGVSAADLEGVGLEELRAPHDGGIPLGAGDLDSQLSDIRAWVETSLPIGRSDNC